MLRVRQRRVPVPETPSRGNLLDWLERLAKVSAVIAIFGWLSLRAHWNHLGISSTADSGVEYYLKEIYTLLFSVACDPLFIACLAATAGVLALSDHGRKLLLLRRGQAADGPVALTPARFVLALILLALYTLATIIIMVLGGWVATDVAVGRLHAEALAPRDARLLLYLTGIVCALGYWLLLRAGSLRTQTLSGRFLWACYLILLVALTLWLPVIFGAAVRQSTYPIARVATTQAPAAPVYGLLVLEAPAVYELWQAEAGAGRVLILPKGQVRELAVGPVYDLLAVARYAAAAPGALPTSAFMAPEDPTIKGLLAEPRE